MEDRIEVSIELKSPVARVWRAITDHEEFGEWFRVKLEKPFEVGGVSRGRITYPGYEHLVWLANIERMDRENLFSFRWHHYDIDVPIDEDDIPKQPTTLVEFRLEPIGSGTKVTITESGFSALPESLREKAFLGSKQGWNEQVKNIAAHVGG